MKQRLRPRAVLLAACVLVVAACASPKPSPPPVDPVKEQIITLQKQLLELQNIQNEVRRKLDEQASLSETLSARIKVLEETDGAARIAPAAAQAGAKPAVQKSAPAKKKTVKQKTKKKKSTVRRQVP